MGAGDARNAASKGRLTAVLAVFVQLASSAGSIC
jgi:hypothetical protein